MKNGIVHKRERKKRKRRGREGFRLEGERESDLFISSNWNPPRGILRFPKERSPRLSLLPLYPEKIPVELLSLLIQYRAGITLFPRTSSYRGMKVTGHCNYLPSFFSIPINQIPCFPPFLQNFSLPVSSNARDDRAKNSILETRVVKEKYGEVVVIQWRRERSHGRRDTRIVDRWIG